MNRMLQEDHRIEQRSTINCWYNHDN